MNDFQEASYELRFESAARIPIAKASVTPIMIASRKSISCPSVEGRVGCKLRRGLTQLPDASLWGVNADVPQGEASPSAFRTALAVRVVPRFSPSPTG